MISRITKVGMSVVLFVFGVSVFAAEGQSEPNEKALSRELLPIALGAAPDPKVMAAIFEKYRHLKSGPVVDNLLMLTISSYTEAGQIDEGVAFADKILADDNFAVGARQSAGLAKAYAQARAGDLATAEQTLDAMLALDPSHHLAKARDDILKQLEGEAAKGKK